MAEAETGVGGVHDSEVVHDSDLDREQIGERWDGLTKWRGVNVVPALRRHHVSRVTGGGGGRNANGVGSEESGVR